jgi:hypothetical protein
VFGGPFRPLNTHQLLPATVHGRRLVFTATGKVPRTVPEALPVEVASD